MMRKRKMNAEMQQKAHYAEHLDESTFKEMGIPAHAVVEPLCLTTQTGLQMLVSFLGCVFVLHTWLLSCFAPMGIIVGFCLQNIWLFLSSFFFIALPHVCERFGVWHKIRADENCLRRFHIKMIQCVYKWLGTGSAIIHHSKDKSFDADTHTQPTIACIHPHGAASLSLSLFMTRDSLKLFRVVGASYVYYFAPFIRMLVEGCVPLGASTRSSVKTYMEGKENLLLYPGGFHEASLACRGKERLYIKVRKGFIKYALVYGYSLTPTYVFGESETYKNAQGGWDFRFFLNDLGIPGILSFGTWWAPIAPLKTPMMAVMGDPLVLPQISNPTKADVDKYQSIYINCLTNLYTRYQPVYVKWHTKYAPHGSKPVLPTELEIW